MTNDDVTKEQPNAMSSDETAELTTEQHPQTPAAGREEGQPTERIVADAPTVSGPGPAAGPTPTERPAPAPSAPPAQRRGPSVPTVVWGLMFGLIAAAVISVQASDVDLNLDVTGPTVLLVAGAALVVWGIAGLGRARRR